MSRGVLMLLLAASLPGCGEMPQGEPLAAAPQPWSGGAGPTRGHEDITRFGVQLANNLIKAELGGPAFYASIPEGEACLTTADELLRGNCRTDMPDAEFTSYYGVSALEFGDHPELQDLHALRNFTPENKPISGWYACRRARARITNAIQMAVAFEQLDDQAAALRWIGHASHTVQDSFTPCHTVRQGSRFETLTDICTYAVQFPGICLHSKPDLKDRIWLGTLECNLTLSRPWECLVPEAQAAANATAGLLLTVARILHNQAWSTTADALEAWFEGEPSNPESGYLRCDGLGHDGWEPQQDQDAGVDAAGDAAADAGLEAGGDTGGPETDAGDIPEASAPDATADSDNDTPEAGSEKQPDAPAEADANGWSEAAADSAGLEPDPPAEASTQEAGCSCRAGPSRDSYAGALALLGVLGLMRKRRMR
jgi:MYXO-CTERM domain-containing protein